jgi:hypothetical protein
LHKLLNFECKVNHFCCIFINFAPKDSKIIDMFDKETYIRRRNELKKLVKSGVIILFGNNESPCNYPNNETLIGDDIDIEDIVWYGSVDCVHDLG